MMVINSGCNASKSPKHFIGHHFCFIQGLIFEKLATNMVYYWYSNLSYVYCFLSVYFKNVDFCGKKRNHIVCKVFSIFSRNLRFLEFQ